MTSTTRDGVRVRTLPRELGISAQELDRLIDGMKIRVYVFHGEKYIASASADRIFSLVPAVYFTWEEASGRLGGSEKLMELVANGSLRPQDWEGGKFCRHDVLELVEDDDDSEDTPPGVDISSQDTIVDEPPIVMPAPAEPRVPHTLGLSVEKRHQDKWLWVALAGIIAFVAVTGILAKLGMLEKIFS